MGIKAIARHMGMARNTVREAVRSDTPPHYERERKGSIVDAVEPQILAVVERVPDDAGHGDRRAHRLAVFDPGAAGPGGGAAAAVRCRPILASGPFIGRAGWASSTCGSPTC